MKSQLNEFMTLEEQEYAKHSPILDLYYTILAKARQIKQEEENFSSAKQEISK